MLLLISYPENIFCWEDGENMFLQNVVSAYAFTRRYNPEEHQLVSDFWELIFL
jgi:hypothetical protein